MLPSPDPYGIHLRDDETRCPDLHKVLALPLGSGMSSSSVTMAAVSAGVWSYRVTDYGGLKEASQ
ncbi:MAG: hypothetical protein PHS60_00500 [Zavarzinia sp.]|nr:hypothetical protein [Zavarzinia sp.]